MDNLYDLIERDRTNWQNCKQALSDRGADMADAATDDFAGKILDLNSLDGFEDATELREFPDIEQNINDGDVRFIILEGSSNSAGIKLLTQFDNTPVTIDWGDGQSSTVNFSNSINKTPSVTHVFSNWQTTASGRKYNVVSFSAPTMTRFDLVRYGTYSNGRRLLWLAVKSLSLTRLECNTVGNGRLTSLVSLYLDCPNAVLGQSYLAWAPISRVSSFVVSTAVSQTAGGLYFGWPRFWRQDVNLSWPAQADFYGFFNNNPVVKKITLSNCNAANSYQVCCSGCSSLQYFKSDRCMQSFLSAFNSCVALEVIDLADAPVNGITNFTASTNLLSLQRVLFPSYIDTDDVGKPRPLADGMTSMGAIELINSGLVRDGLVEMFRSLPVNAALVSCNITGSAGAADLTADDIAIATDKNWTVVR